MKERNKKERKKRKKGEWKLAENCNKSKFGVALLPLSRDQISKLKFIYGNGLHLHGRVLEILHLHAKTEQWKNGQSQNNVIWKWHNFAQNWPKMAEKSMKMIFPDHSVKRKVVENLESYLNMQFQPKIMQRSRENGRKPDFSKNCL